MPMMILSLIGTVIIYLLLTVFVFVPAEAEPYWHSSCWGISPGRPASPGTSARACQRHPDGGFPRLATASLHTARTTRAR